MTFQINTLDVRGPSEFLKIGDRVNWTKLKVLRFAQKLVPLPCGQQADQSELTLVNLATKEEVVLILNKVQDVPSAR